MLLWDPPPLPCFSSFVNDENSILFLTPIVQFSPNLQLFFLCLPLVTRLSKDDLFFILNSWFSQAIWSSPVIKNINIKPKALKTTLLIWDIAQCIGFVRSCKITSIFQPLIFWTLLVNHFIKWSITPSVMGYSLRCCCI